MLIMKATAKIARLTWSPPVGEGFIVQPPIIELENAIMNQGPEFWDTGSRDGGLYFDVDSWAVSELRAWTITLPLASVVLKLHRAVCRSNGRSAERKRAFPDERSMEAFRVPAILQSMMPGVPGHSRSQPWPQFEGTVADLCRGDGGNRFTADNRANLPTNLTNFLKSDSV